MSNYTIYYNVFNGELPITSYLYSGSTQLDSETITGYTTYQYDYVTEGTYFIRLVDNNGCYEDLSFDIPCDITPTPTISVTPTITPSITPSITPTITITPSVTPTITPSTVYECLDSAFDDIVWDIEIQDDSKILCAGDYSNYNIGTVAARIIRLETDGSVDTSFEYGNNFDFDVRTIELQDDGKILCGGDFYSFSGITAYGILRLNTDGYLDSSFNSGTGFTNAGMNVIRIQDDGKILVGGEFPEYRGTTTNFLMRLNSDGTIDTSFSTGNFGTEDINYKVNDIAIQDDGKVLVGGWFISYSGETNDGIIRLNSDGTIDNTFNSGSGFAGTPNHFINHIQILGDGKILVGGNFTSYSGVTSNYLIKLNSDGTIDNTFDIGSGFNNSVWDIKLQSDNKIMIGGYFTEYSGVTANKIIRLNSDGTIDDTFDSGTGFGTEQLKSVFNIETQSNGRYLVSGYLSEYNGIEIYNIARLSSNGTLEMCTEIPITPTPTISVTPTNTPTPTITPTSSPEPAGFITSGATLMVYASNYDGSGTWSDESGNGNDITLYNSPTTGASPSQIIFNGTDQYATTTYSGNDTSDYTYGGWFKTPSSFETYNYFMKRCQTGSGSPSLQMFVFDTDDKLYSTVFTTYNTQCTSAAALSPDTWYYLVSKWDNTTNYLRFYLNGSYVSQVNNGVTNLRTGDLWEIFRQTSTNRTPGSAGAIHIYERGLSDTEIETNFDNTKSDYGY